MSCPSLTQCLPSAYANGEDRCRDLKNHLIQKSVPCDVELFVAIRLSSYLYLLGLTYTCICSPRKTLLTRHVAWSGELASKFFFFFLSTHAAKVSTASRFFFAASDLILIIQK